MKFELYHPEGRINCRSLVDLIDLDSEDIFEILHKCLHIKTAESVGEADFSLKNKHVMLLTNQRLGLAQLTFRLAIDKLNGHALTIPIGGSSIDSFLSGKEYMKVLPLLKIDAFCVETSVEEDAEKLSRKIQPVINAHHKNSPIVNISRLLTIYEHFRKLSGIRVCYLSEASKINSTIAAFCKCGLDINFVAPIDKKPSQEVLDYAAKYTQCTYTFDLDAALKTCDVLYIDNDFGSEYYIDAETLSLLDKNAIVLHSIPLSEETDASMDIMDDSRCKIANCGANRVYALSAVLELIIGK